MGRLTTSRSVGRSVNLVESITLEGLSNVAAKTGTGTTVVMQGSPSITTPTISDLTNMQHAHTNAATGGTVSAGVDPATANCRLDYTNTTTVTLTPTGGNKITINGVSETVSSQTMVSGTTLISASGTNLGTNMVADTLYYIYLAGASSSYDPDELHPSATAYTLVNGVPYLASSGNGANWRFVGYLKTTSALLFADSETQRNVKSQNNRVPKKLHLCPGKNDNSSATTVSVNSPGAYIPHPSVSSPHISFITDGYESVMIHITVGYQGNGYDIGAGIGIDSTTSSSATVFAAGAVTDALSTAISSTLNEGYHFANLLITTSGAKNIYSDFTRFGGSADPEATYIGGLVLC